MNKQTNKPATQPTADLWDDLVVSQVSRRAVGSGAWVTGTLAGHRFEALVFPGHASDPAYEIGDSRISKLWVQRLADRMVVYNWDRGLDRPAADALAQQVVDFLCEGLADYAYAD